MLNNERHNRDAIVVVKPTNGTGIVIIPLPEEVIISKNSNKTRNLFLSCFFSIGTCNMNIHYSFLKIRCP